jgi:translation initiation factor IF-3
VIGANGDQLGILQTMDARRMARELGLDLVEVNPKAQPPVCKIMDFGRFKYEEKKKLNEAKKRQKSVELKEVKLRPKTDEHDIDFKVKHVRRFLEEGNQVKITVRFRGREITHPETAEKQIRNILEAVTDIGSLEQASRLEGRAMTAIVAPKVARRAPGPAERGGASDADMA